MNVFNDFEKALYVQQQLLTHVPRLRKHGHVWRFRCPVCGDSKSKTQVMRGNYYTNTDSYYCFRCHFSAQGFGLLAKISNTTYSAIQSAFIQSLRAPVYTVDDTTKPITDQYKSLKPIERVKSIVIPDSWVTPPRNIQKIIDDRKLTSAPFYPKRWKQYYEQNLNRLVIPWVRENEIKCFQYRRLNDNEDVPKYAFGKDQVKDVFNLDMIDETLDFVFLVEGVYDCIFVKNGVSTGGLNPAADQLDLIEERTYAQVVYMPDNQHQDSASMAFTNKLIDDGKLVFIWPKSIKQKDVNQYFIETGRKDFENFDWLKQFIKRGVLAKLALK